VLQSPKPILVVDLFPEILDQLLKLLIGLDSEEWSRPTVCHGWSVKDVALHLLGGEIGNLSRRRDNHSVGVSIDGLEQLVAYINDWNQQWVETTKRISSPILIDLLDLTGGQMCDYFRSLDPYAMGGPVSWIGPEPVPVWVDMAREYTERWHHQQHIREAVDQPRLLQPRYMAPILETFVLAAPRTFRSASASEGTSVTLTIKGESGGEWSVRQEDGDWRLYQGALEQPDAGVLIEQEIAWRLFTRGLSQDVAVRQMNFTGDRTLGMIVLDMVSIIA
jgi:uncharacterized protein (TIGR03083 family)